ncbi:hypothetical protein QQ045_013985 [Rhodiola kirilowii]
MTQTEETYKQLTLYKQLRRGFAVLYQAVEGSRKKVMIQKPTKMEPAPWIPDPKIGYYRPENAPDEIDLAELLAMLLKPIKNKRTEIMDSLFSSFIVV